MELHASFNAGLNVVIPCVISFVICCYYIMLSSFVSLLFMHYCMPIYLVKNFWVFTRSVLLTMLLPIHVQQVYTLHLAICSCTGKTGSPSGWIWVDAKVDGKPYVGAMPPVTATAEGKNIAMRSNRKGWGREGKEGMMMVVLGNEWMREYGERFREGAIGER